jgi:hypothetical protein
LNLKIGPPLSAVKDLPFSSKVTVREENAGYRHDVLGGFGAGSRWPKIQRRKNP